MLTLYGIPNCDSVRKARDWLAAEGIAYAFHDYKKAGVPDAELRGWVGRIGWEALLNRRGTTFRALPEEDRAELDEAKAIAIMLAHPSTIKRPVAVSGDTLLVGFSPAEWKAALG